MGKVEEKMCADLGKLREYYEIKLELRDSIYKDEVQQLVSHFNKNYDLNKSMLESLIKEKYEFEEEIRSLKEAHQEYIEVQEEKYEHMIN